MEPMDDALRAVRPGSKSTRVGESIKELLPLLEDEPLRLVMQNDLSEKLVTSLKKEPAEDARRVSPKNRDIIC